MPKPLPHSQKTRVGGLAGGDFRQDRKHLLRHTGHEAWRLVVIVVGKKPLPAATTGLDESSHFVRDTSLWAFHFNFFNRHLLSCPNCFYFLEYCRTYLYTVKRSSYYTFFHVAQDSVCNE